MNGESAVFRALEPGERDACVQLWRTVWPGDNEGYFRRYLFGDVEWLPYYTQVAVVGEQIVSAVHICKRIVACGDFRLTMGGIANVVSLPEYRGRGFNTECLRRAIKVMEADAMDFSLLFTGIHGYYARQGYSNWPRIRWAGRIREDFTPDPACGPVRPAIVDDIPAIRALYDAYNRDRSIAVRRDEAYWREWIGLSPDRLRESMLICEDAGGTQHGYLCYHVTQQALNISEIGLSTLQDVDRRSIALALLQGAAARALAAGRRQMQFDVPDDPPLTAAQETILVDRKAVVNTSGMTRLLHRDNLLRSLVLEWNDRWISAGRPRGRLAFDTPYGPTEVDASGDFLQVRPVEEAAELLSQETLFGLLFGTLRPRPHDVDGIGGPLARALFRDQSPIYWSADGF